LRYRLLRLWHLRALDARWYPGEELRLEKARGPHKLCIVDHGLRAIWLEEQIPLDPARLEASIELTDLAGHIAESVVGALLTGLPGLDVAHFPERATEPRSTSS
jgi:hypothetical protein